MKKRALHKSRGVRVRSVLSKLRELWSCGAAFDFNMSGSDAAWGRGLIVMTPNERAKEFDRAIHTLERELTSRPHLEAGRNVLGKVLAALWALRAEAADQPARTLH